MKALKSETDICFTFNVNLLEHKVWGGDMCNTALHHKSICLQSSETEQKQLSGK